ncbi:tRNA1(Val) (adenine(37)-N6)-methyltransferase [Pseudahrensia aquimaris]|uniref:tRNA1(Val) (Adenine(37)-N6)-methyltransferase n=1 Tax=Pseudahrensia aquimaris TaxID=744461 RepID=A0ABW3FEV4_9HYPH
MAGLHSNTFRVHQQSKTAHRPGMDALLLAATVPSDQVGLVADYGAGNGAVGMAVLNRCPACQVDLIERDIEMTQLIYGAMMDPFNDHLAARMRLVRADVTDTAQMKKASDRTHGCYDRIVANPPYNTADHRASPDPKRAAAHQMEEGGLTKWIISANTMLKSKGVITFILRPVNLPEVLQAMQGRFGAIAIKPVQSKQVAAAKRILVCAQKASAAPLQLLPPIILHQADGTFTQTADAVFAGQGFVSMQA